MYKFWLIFLFSILWIGNSAAQQLKLTGRWDVSNISYIINPGSDINSIVTSSSNQIELGVTGNLNQNGWQVQVSKSDIDWNNQMEIWIKRTGSGTGGGAVYSGTSFQKINNIPMSFINGTKSLNKIPLQLEIRNLSVTIPARDYSTNIVYTLFEL